MSIIKDLEWRYAVKKFGSGRLTEKQVNLLIESVRLAPSAFGLQPYQLLILESEKARETLLPHCFGQGKVANCSHLFILAHKTNLNKSDIENYVSGLAEVQGTSIAQLSQHQSQIETSIFSMTRQERIAMAKQQSFIALGTLLSAAASEQIDTCPMTGFDADGVDQVLGLEHLGLSATALCPAGYRDANDHAAHRAKYRKPLKQLALFL